MAVTPYVFPFWPAWLARVAWALSLVGLGWSLAAATIPPAFGLAAGATLALQALLALLALLKRRPAWDDWLSALAGTGALAVALLLWPDRALLWLMLGWFPFMDVARRRGAWALLLLLLFPVAPLVLPHFGGTLAAVPQDALVWSVWLASLALACLLVKVRRSETLRPAPEPALPPLYTEGLLERGAQLLARETNYERILSVLVRSGTEALDNGDKGRHRARALALTFRPGLADVLVVTAQHNMDLRESTIDVQGVLATLLHDGDPIETDSDQPPFSAMKVLAGHSLLLFPLRTGLEMYGAVLFATRDTERAQGDAVQRTLIALTDQASLALHNAKLQQDLRRNQAQRMDGDEEARHQLARDLHDGPVQRVAAIAMQLDFIKQLMKRQPERALSEIENVQQVVRQASQEMRTMLFTLRPVVLESEGLGAALGALVKRLHEQDGLPITFEADPLPRLDPKVEDVAFAILQEAVGNAKKYAGGAPIRVRLIKGQSVLVGQVEDEGPGFDLKGISSSYGTRASLGLLNMQERAAMVGGTLRIDTAPDKGTVVSIALPLARA